MAARASGKQPPAAEEMIVTLGNDSVEKCVNCQFYDRRHARPVDGKAPMWGQCRRHSPRPNPLTAKTYVVEGVWPLVRDDDWCGEWKVLTRTLEALVPESTAPAVEGPLNTPSRSRPAPGVPAAEPAVAGDD